MPISFFQKIQYSIYGPDFYRELHEKPFAHSLRYFLTLCLLLAVIGTVLFAIRIVPAINAFVIETGPQIAANYPDNLIVTISKGTLSANIAGPSFIKLPEKGFIVRQETSNPPLENLIVIDANASPTAEKLREYKTLVLATKDTIVYDTGNGIEFSSYGKFSGTTLTKQVVENFSNRLRNFAFLIASMVVGAIFIFVFLFFAAKLAYLLLGALIILLLAKIRKTPCEYKYAYRIGLHTITPAILVQSLLAAYGIRIPYLFTAIFILAILANFPATPRTKKAESV